MLDLVPVSCKSTFGNLLRMLRTPLNGGFASHHTYLNLYRMALDNLSIQVKLDIVLS